MMSYLFDFQAQIATRDFAKILELWEEYCSSETVDAEELQNILQTLKASEFAPTFGHYVEMVMNLWKTITDEQESWDVLRLIFDLQISQSPELAELALSTLQRRYGKRPEFQEWFRLTGLRSGKQFQGVLSHFDLLAHMAPGKFVSHGSGWGTGEILEVSMLREQLVIEFENVGGRKDISFANAFKTLVPLSDDHFLAMRFGNPDALELIAKEQPVAFMRKLLHDLGPKTAGEIKDILEELVIPEKEWTKWWQGVRAKIKKDPLIEAPDNLKEPFRLRTEEVSPETKFLQAVQAKQTVEEVIEAVYGVLRDYPKVLKEPSSKKMLQDKLDSFEKSTLTDVQAIQIDILLNSYFENMGAAAALQKRLEKLENVESVVKAIEVVALKRRLLEAVRQHRADWEKLFLFLLFTVPQALVREYLFKELCQGETKKRLEEKLRAMTDRPAANPEFFFWYFQKILGDASVPFSDKAGKFLFLDSLMVMLHQIESKPEYKDLAKKIYQLLTGKRYEVVRKLLEGTTIAFAKEFLLLASKCHTFEDHDQKILRSLVEVVHPTLATHKEKRNDNIVWATEGAFKKAQEELQRIGTVEMVDNAREIEVARGHGDLRENSEYKFAQERRARLQIDLKTLSEQVQHARILHKEDISTDEVGVGTVVEVVDIKGKKSQFTILGPWDADADKNILSLQSKLALAMVGLKVGDSFEFRDETLTITAIKSYL